MARPLLMLQVCIDDSKEQPDFIYSGYVARVEEWETFADEWQALLNESRLSRLKGNEITKILRWLSPDEREKRLARFGMLIRKHVSYGVDLSVPYDDYKWLLKNARKQGRKVSRAFKNPFSFMVSHLLCQVAMAQIIRNEFEKVECIFDRGTDKQPRLEQAYRAMYSILPDEIHTLFSPDPVFRDDADFLPLQAADLRAWYSHRCLLNKRPNGALWHELEQIKHLPIRLLRKDFAIMLKYAGLLPFAIGRAIAVNYAESLRGRIIRTPSGKIL